MGFKFIYKFWILLFVALLSLVKEGVRGNLRKLTNGLIYFSLY